MRGQVDQNRLSVLETEDDIHVLAGALKLFLREMREPLIPTEMFDKFLRASRMQKFFPLYFYYSSGSLSLIFCFVSFSLFFDITQHRVAQHGE